jgi:NAD-dependent deacetylase
MTIGLTAASQLADLATRVADAARITVLTGAGVSAASGVPTFRGDGGLWRSFRAEDLATPQAFYRNPTLIWEWYDWRRSLIARCEPNPAHERLARLSQRPGVTLITQNVDGLHERAGSRDVIRFHGSIWQLRCAADCCPDPWDDLCVPLPHLPPPCRHCGRHARPGVVWFGEAIDPAILQRSLEATACDLFLSIGTSSVVHPAAGLLAQAKAQGAYTVEINPEPTDRARYIDVAVALPAEHALPKLVV